MTTLNEQLSVLLENDLEKAELILAAQDIMNDLQEMSVDLAKANAQKLFPLVDKMKTVFGADKAHEFEVSSTAAMNSAMNSVRRAKDELGDSILRLEGNGPTNDMAGFGAEGDVSDPIESAFDDFEGSDGNTGPEGEPLGREKRVESREYQNLSESKIYESAGRKLLERYDINKMVSWMIKLAESEGMPAEQIRSFSASLKDQAEKNPEKVAGWIGAKKHGMAAMAQLARPVNTQSTAPQDITGFSEGKSFRHTPDEDEDESETINSKKKNARSKKPEWLEEAESPTKGSKKISDHHGDDGYMAQVRYDRDNEDHSVHHYHNGKHLGEGPVSYHGNGKEGKEDATDTAKYNVKHYHVKNGKVVKKDSVKESVVAAKLLAHLIERSIQRTGKGSAQSHLTKMSSVLFPMNESASNPLLEAFKTVFECSPGSYSAKKLKEFNELSSNDKAIAGQAVTTIANNLSTKKISPTSSMSSALNTMTPQERTVAQKMISNLQSQGKSVNTVADFTASQEDSDTPKPASSTTSSTSNSNSTQGTTGTQGTN